MTRTRETWLLGVFWLVVCAAMSLLAAHSIREMLFPDPDDAMRLLEVRDWLAGQSWFDVTQYRLNPPAGAPMHWSRLVDLPIAAVMLVSRPFVGLHGADVAALVAVPLLTLGIAMLLVQRIGLQLMSGRAALLAAMATPFSLGAMKQMRPMRIDHHGWQIVCALVAVLSALDQRPRRSGVVAGIALAVSMTISIEGLPFAAGLGALFAWQWLVNPAAGERLKYYLASLAVSSALAFGLTHVPSAWLDQPHDVMTAANLISFAVAALIAALAVRPSVDTLTARLAILAGIGAAALMTMFLVDPHWLQGPFGSLDPLVRAYWYNQVDEGLPAWQVGWSEAALGLAQPVVGLVGAALACRGSAAEARKNWATYLILLGAMSFASLFVMRIATTASVVAMPGTAFLCQIAFRRARTLSLMPLRSIATAGALCIMTPAYAVPLTMTPADGRYDDALTAFHSCVSSNAMERLKVLPTGQVAAPLDISPAILVNSRHSAIASGHHRNAQGMHDVIELFLAPPAVGATILQRRRVDYLAFCVNAAESIRYARRGRGGLAATLQAGRPPSWLEPLPAASSRYMKVWRVRHDLLPQPVHS